MSRSPPACLWLSIIDQPSEPRQPASESQRRLRGLPLLVRRIAVPAQNTFDHGPKTDAQHVFRRGGPHFLVLLQVSDEIALTSNRPLVPFDDPDQGKRLVVGETHRGNIDFPTDIDYYFLDLHRGEKVDIAVRSILADPQLDVGSYQGETLAVWISDDDSGGGLFGLDARIILQAPHTGEYILRVENVHPISYAPAGYVISVSQARATDPTTPLTPLVTIDSPINVRAGPGTNYAVIGTAAPGEQFAITGKSPGSGDWWQINYDGRTGWVYRPLVTATNAHDVEVVSPE